MAELAEYCNSEGAELGRYEVNTTRREEELKDFRGEARSYLSIIWLLILHLVHLADGLKRERENTINLVYAPVANDLPSDEADDEADDDNSNTVVAFELQYPQEAPMRVSVCRRRLRARADITNLLHRYHQYRIRRYHHVNLKLACRNSSRRLETHYR
jgi:hypothetical protein